MEIHLIAFTNRGSILCSLLMKELKGLEYNAIGFTKYEKEGLILLTNNLKDFTRNAFKNSSVIVFIGATGIAVRAIAPFITSKDKDPAVIVVDEFGENVIPILSGHIGRANEFAKIIAKITKGNAIITTATDLNKKFAVDVWASKNNLHIENISNIKEVSASVLQGEKIGFCCDFEVLGALPAYLATEKVEIGICITKEKNKNLFAKTLLLTPKQYVLGIGCKKNTDEKDLEEFIVEILNKKEISPHLINSISTINIKKDEKAIVSLCNKYLYELKTYTSNELAEVEGKFTASEFVKSIVGVDNVCERAAVLASDNGRLLLNKTSRNGMTVAIAIQEWRCKF